MRLYTIHRRPGGNGEEAAFVKEGFSWPALFLGPLWFLYHRLWLYAGLSLLIGVAVSGLLAALEVTPPFQIAADAGIVFLIAASANDLRRRKLELAGLDFVEVLMAPNLKTAETVYFHRQSAADTADMAVAQMPASAPPPRRHGLTPFASQDFDRS